MGHGSTVNCFRFGRKSGQVAVSGGDDTNINIWRIRENETKNIMSLAGHSSAVECVTFDPAEKRVVAGSTSGAIKAYDMEAAKVYRSLKGHMSSCMTIDYHLYGDYVASGSLDTNVKIWDLKTKNCVQTFKGHASEITCVSFTPDGRWLTSGSADGTLKIWDLTAGKLLQEFNDHSNAITCLEFNPEEYILVSASQDKTMRFWDLQAFDLLGVTPTDNSATSSISHTISEPYSGKYAICTSQDMVKIWSYEVSIQCHDSVLWNKQALSNTSECLGDTLVTDNLQLFGASFSNAFVSIWRVDLTQLQPFKKPSAKPSTPALSQKPSAPAPSQKPSTPQTNYNKPATPLHVTKPSTPAAITPSNSTSSLASSSRPTTPANTTNTTPLLVKPKTPQVPTPIETTSTETAMGSETIARFNEKPDNSEYVKELKVGMEISIRAFKSRQKALEQFLKYYWDKGDIHGAFRFLSQLPSGTREALSVDVFNNIDLASVGLDLEACVLLLPLALELISPTCFESHLIAGVNVSKVLVTAFAPLVKDNREARRNNREVNFAGEERAARCDACHGYFIDLQNKLQAIHLPSCARTTNELKALLSEYGWGR
ncbi:katanin p80 subunit [Thraustotheca clavata]|uniref:Katanin p80 WD40 repeat-containing subunit B1 homolog n=1 Tax=Thraustotheca clavata TaxID=74557 RepID=A0A1V9YRX7_9STRA|nr:katanin p80 subunit [Thraustotheca clavata]